MSTNKTEHLQLHQWESGDAVLRREFNENFAKLDSAAKAAETEAARALSAYQTANDAAVAALGARTPRIKTGSYVGTGSCGKDSPNTLNFDFAPKLVVVARNDTKMLVHGTVLIAGQTLSGGIGTSSSAGTMLGLTVSWPANGVSWYAGQAEKQLNDADGIYHYFAIG